MPNNKPIKINPGPDQTRGRITIPPPLPKPHTGRITNPPPKPPNPKKGS